MASWTAAKEEEQIGLRRPVLTFPDDHTPVTREACESRKRERERIHQEILQEWEQKKKTMLGLAGELRKHWHQCEEIKKHQQGYLEHQREAERHRKLLRELELEKQRQLQTRRTQEPFEGVRRQAGQLLGTLQEAPLPFSADSVMMRASAVSAAVAPLSTTVTGGTVAVDGGSMLRSAVVGVAEDLLGGPPDSAVAAGSSALAQSKKNDRMLSAAKDFALSRVGIGSSDGTTHDNDSPLSSLIRETVAGKAFQSRKGEEQAEAEYFPDVDDGIPVARSTSSGYPPPSRNGGSHQLLNHTNSSFSPVLRVPNAVRPAGAAVLSGMTSNDDGTTDGAAATGFAHMLVNQAKNAIPPSMLSQGVLSAASASVASHHEPEKTKNKIVSSLLSEFDSYKKAQEEQYGSGDQGASVADGGLPDVMAALGGLQLPPPVFPPPSTAAGSRGGGGHRQTSSTSVSGHQRADSGSSVVEHPEVVDAEEEDDDEDDDLRNYRKGPKYSESTRAGVAQSPMAQVLSAAAKKLFQSMSPTMSPRLSRRESFNARGRSTSSQSEADNQKAPSPTTAGAPRGVTPPSPAQLSTASTPVLPNDTFVYKSPSTGEAAEGDSFRGPPPSTGDIQDAVSVETTGQSSPAIEGDPGVSPTKSESPAQVPSPAANDIGISQLIRETVTFEDAQKKCNTYGTLHRLRHKPSFFRSWKLRQVFIGGYMMYLFREKCVPTDYCVEMICLPEAKGKIMDGEFHGMKLVLALRLPNEQQPYIIAFRHEDEKKTWMNAIFKAQDFGRSVVKRMRGMSVGGGGVLVKGLSSGGGNSAKSRWGKLKADTVPTMAHIVSAAVAQHTEERHAAVVGEGSPTRPTQQAGLPPGIETRRSLPPKPPLKIDEKTMRPKLVLQMRQDELFQTVSYFEPQKVRHFDRLLKSTYRDKEEEVVTMLERNNKGQRVPTYRTRVETMCAAYCPDERELWLKKLEDVISAQEALRRKEDEAFLAKKGNAPPQKASGGGPTAVSMTPVSVGIPEDSIACFKEVLAVMIQKYGPEG